MPHAISGPRPSPARPAGRRSTIVAGARVEVGAGPPTDHKGHFFARTFADPGS